jgi:iron(III) transport system substrate-binding protein
MPIARRYPAALGALLAGMLMGASPAAALSQSEIAMLAGPDRQQILEQGARQEGAVMIYSGIIVDQALRPLVEGFARKYPFVKAEFWRGDSRPIVQKILAEEQAGRVIADVLEGTGLSQALVQAGILEPFTSPELAAMPADHLDPNHLWAPTRLSYFGAAFNTKLVKAAEAPRSYEALLDDKWRGKIAWVTEAQEGMPIFITNLRLAWGEQRAEAYLAQLAKQRLIPFGESGRALVNRVMDGEYPIALAIFLHHPLISARAGAPVDALPMDPVSSLAGTVVLPQHVPHPHAAMLLIDFLLSPDGQRILAGSDYFPSNHDVKPAEYLRRIVPGNIGMSERFLRPEIWAGESERTQALYEKYFE